ncbi:MAG: peptidoglycan-binding protein [Clostridia bacterium]|nr:peptidoglycan-binding protein [Clostridia bacterium]
MYLQDERQRAIKEIQKYLSVTTPAAPARPSGVYDADTKRAVEEFQRKTGLSETGRVDYPTFVALYEEYKKEIIKEQLRARYQLFYSLPTRVGDVNVGARRINEMLTFVLDYYGLDTGVRKTNAFLKASAEGVNEIRRAFLMSEGDYVDAIFLDRLIKEYASASFFKNSTSGE